MVRYNLQSADVRRWYAVSYPHFIASYPQYYTHKVDIFHFTLKTTLFRIHSHHFYYKNSIKNGMYYHFWRKSKKLEKVLKTCWQLRESVVKYNHQQGISEKIRSEKSFKNLLTTTLKCSNIRSQERKTCERGHKTSALWKKNKEKGRYSQYRPIQNQIGFCYSHQYSIILWF